MDSLMIKPEDRIIEFFRDKPFFSSKDVINLLEGQETARTLYRAINKLEQEGRIRFLRYLGRVKIYTAIGQTNLPQFRSKDGKRVAPISFLVKNINQDITGIYKDNRWVDAELINDIPAAIAQLFIIAQHGDDPKMQRIEIIQSVQMLEEARKRLTWMLELVNGVLNHPIMSGAEVFNRLLNDEDDPAQPPKEALTAFKVWYKQYTDNRS